MTQQIVDSYNGRPLTAEGHFALYGQNYRQGLLSEWTQSFEAAGGALRPAASGSGLTWAVAPNGTTRPVVCSEIVPISTEDGPSYGRCGADATDDGACPRH